MVFSVGLVRGRLRAAHAGAGCWPSVSLLVAIGLTVANWDPGDTKPIIEGALAIDTLALFMSMLFFTAGLATVALSLRAEVVREAGSGEYLGLLLGSISGMVILAGAENLVTLFVGIELLSIPLYVLCASELHRRELARGRAQVPRRRAPWVRPRFSTDWRSSTARQARPTSTRSPTPSAAPSGWMTRCCSPASRSAATGLAFKASVAPFHQWTPDVYQGAPTPVTSFMAVATKAAAFAIILRLFDYALGGAQTDWAPALAALAVITIVIGNAGAIAQRSLKRMLAWSGVAQAGYLLAGVVVGTRLGLQATASTSPPTC